MFGILNLRLFWLKCWILFFDFFDSELCFVVIMVEFVEEFSEFLFYDFFIVLFSMCRFIGENIGYGEFKGSFEL